MLIEDANINGVGCLKFLVSFIVPNYFNAIIWIRVFQTLERYHLPTFIPFRILLHVHGLEFANNVTIGAGLRLPHPRGVLFTTGTVIGERCSIYGNVRFVRIYSEVPTVGDNVLIGDGAICTGKARIGNNSIIGAGSVVTKPFGDNLTVASHKAPLAGTVLS